MSDVFISYSRKDSEFAKRLTNALKVREKDVWIDWEDIPRAEDWLNEIYSGIESADTFVFIVSEHSLRSEICNYEIAHARKNNKRIVPLIRQRIEDEIEIQVKGSWVDQTWEQTARDNWQRIRHLNWLFFDDEVRFEAELDALGETLVTDQAHVKLHTRLLVRAREWESSGRAPGFLLTEEEIEQAQEWLDIANSQEKTPKPTVLHLQYINASQQAEQTRKENLQRLEMRTRQFRRAALGLLLVVFLTIFAVVASTLQLRTTQAQVAMAQEDLTDVQFEANVANFASTSVRQTQQSVSLQQTQVQNTFLTVTPALATVNLAEAEIARAYAQGTETMNQVQEQLNSGESLRLSAAASLILRRQGDRELATLLSIRGLSHDQTPETAYTLADSMADFISAYTLPGMDYVYPTEEDENTSDLFGILPDGDIAISPNSQLLAISDGYSVRIYDITENGPEVYHYDDEDTLISGTSNIISLDFSIDGIQLATGTSEGIITSVNIETMQTVRDSFSSSFGVPWQIVEDPIHTLAFSTNNTLIAAHGTEFSIWDLFSQIGPYSFFQEDEYLGVQDEVHVRATIAPNGQNIAFFLVIEEEISYSEGRRRRFLARTYDVTSGNLQFTLVDQQSPLSRVTIDLEPSHGIRIAPDNDTIAVWMWGSVRFYSLRSGQEIGSLELDSDLGYVLDPAVSWFLPIQITAADFSPSGQTFFVGTKYGVSEWDVETGQLLRFLGSVNGGIFDLEISPDASFLVAGGVDQVRAWDLQVSPGEQYIFEGDYEAIIVEACSRVTRDFSELEREVYGLDDSPTCPVNDREE